MWHVIVNPAAGRGRARRTRIEAERHLREASVAHRVHVTDRPGHAGALTERLPGDARVAALGGDGTIREVAIACLGTDRLLGVIPAGSGDDFAHALGLPRPGVAAAVAALKAGRVRRVDVGLANGAPFLNAVGMGADAEVGALVTQAPRPLRGVGAYLWAVATVLRRLRASELRLRVDGREVFAGPALLASTQNGPRAGGSFVFAPHARLDDGRLEVVLARAMGPGLAARLVPALMRGRHLEHPSLSAFSGCRIGATWSRPQRWHTDGEVHAPVTHLEVELRPGALRVVAP